MCIMGTQNRDRYSTHDRKQRIDYLYYRLLCYEKTWGNTACGCHPFLLKILFRNVCTFYVKSEKRFRGPELTEYNLFQGQLVLELGNLELAAFCVR